jgi:uncharacterized membrane protein YgcG
MNKKATTFITVILAVFVLAACGAKTSTTSTRQSSSSSSSGNTTGANITLSNETKLALGIAKLEGTPNAITVDQAKTLLFLWKGVKSISASNTTAEAEMLALDQQIKDTLTPAQITAIDAMNLSAADMRTVMAQLGVQSTSSSTRSSTTSNSGGFPGGGFPGGGFPGGGNFTGGGNTRSSASSSSTASSTTSLTTSFKSNFVNTPLLNGLIAMLQKKVGG